LNISILKLGDHAALIQINRPPRENLDLIEAWGSPLGKLPASLSNEMGKEGRKQTHECSKCRLFDHIVGCDQKRSWRSQAERIGSA
jgi:hypothetical protein